MDAAFLLARYGSQWRAVYRFDALTQKEGTDLLAYLHQYNRQWQSSLALEWAASVDVPTRMRRTKEVTDARDAAEPNWLGELYNNRPLQALREAAASGERQILAMRTPTVMPDNASVKAQKPPARSARGGDSGGPAATEGPRAAAGSDSDANAPARSDGRDEPAGLALTNNETLVLQTLTVFDASQLVSTDAIAAEMDAPARLSARTIGPIVQKLMRLDLAERPEGRQGGARLTMAGRRLASKIAN